MNRIKSLLFTIILIVVVFQTGVAKEINQSPYFLLASGNKIENFALLATNVHASISGVCADVTVEQVYVNRGGKALEAVYVFPASSKSAVYGMTMYVGSRELVAVCKRKEAARKDYEQAKKEGKRASLLEQFKPNVFQMNVANIKAGDTIKTVMKYVENISAEAGEYEFVYPTVVGPRYSNSDVKENDKFTRDANTSGVNAVLSSAFNIKVDLLAGMKIMQVYSSSHKIKVEYGTNPEAINTSASITLEKGENAFGKDFILKYSFNDFNMQTGLLINKNQKENYFLLTLQPPARFEAKDIPPREYIFILDVSGSMDGFPLEISKKTILKIIDGLRPEDKFNVIFFAGGSETMFCEPVNAEQEIKSIAKRKINSYGGGGGTELMNALKSAFESKKSPGYSRTIAILTDGYVTVEEQAFDFIKNNLGDANFFALGIGQSVNRFLIEGIARIGKGEAFVVDKKEAAEETADKFNTYIRNPIMTNIKFESEGILTSEVIPAHIPDLFADRPIIIYGKYEGLAGGKFTVSGDYLGKRIKVEMPVLKFAEFDESQALKYFWVRNKIAELDDYSGVIHGRNPKAKKIEEEVTQLGEKYNLLTKYTSFVAIDDVISDEGDEDVEESNPLMPARKRANSSNNSGMDLGAMSSNVDFSSSVVTSKVNVIEKESEPDINSFEEVEKEPTVDIKKLSSLIIYPLMAKKANVEGKVVVRVLIDKTGRVSKLAIFSSDNEMLNKAAFDAIKNYGRFEPAIQNGNPIACWINIPIIFSLVDDLPNEATQNNTYGSWITSKMKSNFESLLKQFNNDFDYLDYLEKYKEYPPTSINMQFKYLHNGYLDTNLLFKNTPDRVKPYLVKIYKANYYYLIVDSVNINNVLNDKLNLNFDLNNLKYSIQVYEHPESDIIRTIRSVEGHKLNLTVVVYANKCDIKKIIKKEKYELFKNINNFKFDKYLCESSKLTSLKLKYDPGMTSEIFPELKGLGGEDLELELIAEISAN